MKTLHELALKYGTDKGPDGHNYTEVYDRLLSPLRNKQITLVELGVWEGASLAMWREYFPKATVIGIDLNGDHYVRRVGNTTFIEADVSEPVEGVPDFVDVVIDDASHQEEQQKATLNWLLPRTRQWYFVEDLHTLWWPQTSKHGAFDRIYRPLLDLTIGGGATRWTAPFTMHFYPSLVAIKISRPSD
jgi:hypothetical protein